MFEDPSTSHRAGGGDEIIVRREISNQGRSRSFINGALATAAAQGGREHVLGRRVHHEVEPRPVQTLARVGAHRPRGSGPRVAETVANRAA